MPSPQPSHRRIRMITQLSAEEALQRLARSIEKQIPLFPFQPRPCTWLFAGTIDGHHFSICRIPAGKLIFHIFGALAEFERDLIRERTYAGLAAARARGRKGGRPRVAALSDAKKITLALSLYNDKNNSIVELGRRISASVILNLTAVVYCPTTICTQQPGGPQRGSEVATSSCSATSS
jgi:hypothetical protein